MILFVSTFILDSAVSFYKYYSTEVNVALDFLIALITPLTFAITISVIYMFIFELNRIRIQLQGVEFDRKYKKLQVIRAVCITFTFIPVVLLSITNLNLYLSKEDKFLKMGSEFVLKAVSGLAKLIVDIYIYWNL